MCVYFSVKAMLLIIECKYQLIRENKVTGVAADDEVGITNKDYMPDKESIEDGLKSNSKTAEEVMNLIEEHNESRSHKDHKVRKVK